MSKFTATFSEEEIKRVLRLIKNLSGVDGDLETAVSYALFYANSEERREIEMIQTLLSKLASGSVRLSFNLYQLYKSV